MGTFAAIVFWGSVGLMFHCYILYPVLLKMFSVGKKENDMVFSILDDNLPSVYIVFSVFNEQKVIQEKLESVIRTKYPIHKLSVFIGSDNSTDETNAIVDAFAVRHSQIHFF